MDFHKFLQTAGANALQHDADHGGSIGRVDLGCAAAVEVDRDLYLEADARGMSLSELLECDEFDPTPHGSPLDAFERQLALSGVQLGGKHPTTVEQFFQKASSLMPEFMLREIKKGQAMRPELSRLVANSTTVSSNRYTPFFIDTSTDTKFSLRPIGDGAEVPQLLVNEQTHAVNVTDYGLALKASYKALRYRNTSQFRVVLWYIGFMMQSDKIGMVVDTIINGDGNDNAASVINTDVSGTLDYDDLVKLWASFSPFDMNTMICHIDGLKTILALDEFKDPLAGYRFQSSGELFSPLGAALVRSDEVPTDYVIGLDNRFAIEEVVTQPLMVEYDKIIEQRFEEAVISESVTFAKVIKEASVILDSVYS
ncbi:MAG: hypothetical protein DRP45_02070 [Candidatus Zixiibacteriota bacterium]|nr:MAG: hypothetical protein DRP45_02070 [candidate division Zixibacteria bacterium]